MAADVQSSRAGSPAVRGMLLVAAMAAVMWPLSDSLYAAMPAGAAVYLGVLFVVERALNPADVEFILSMLRRRLRPGTS